MAALEAKVADPAVGGGTASDVHEHLAAALATTALAGPLGDPVPVVVDDALSHAPADRRWELLDRLLRMSEKHQVIYLTDDAFVAAWARRARREDLLLLEPTAEPLEG